MKVLAIRGENLASLAGAFELDLTEVPLGGSGLFAVTGPTGSGKSTLLDALCLALYDRTPRLGGRGGSPVGYRHPRDADDLRSHDPRGILRRGAGSGFAEVDFVGRGGRRYRATWRVRRARGRPDGRLQPQTLELCDLERDQQLGGHTKTETLAAIERAVGLDYDAFARSVLLAQGEFAAFLRADAADRAELLERLSGSALYGRVSSLAHGRARVAREELKLLEVRAGALTRLAPEARASLQAERDAAEADTGEARAALHTLELRQRSLCACDTARTELASAEAARTRAHAEHTTAGPLRAACEAAERALPLRPLHEAVLRLRAAQASAQRASSGASEAHVAAQRALDVASAEATGAEERLLAASNAASELATRIASARALDAQLAVAGVEDTRAAELLEARTGALEAAAAELASATTARDASAEARTTGEAALGKQALGLALAQTEPHWRPALEGFVVSAQAHAAALAVRAERLQTVQAVRERDAACAAAFQAAEEAQAEATQALAEAPADDTTDLEALAAARQHCAALRRACEEAVRAATDVAAARSNLANAEAAQLTLRAADSAQRLELQATEEALLEARAGVAAVERTRDLAAQRADLEPEQPCPLCGATEHPYAHALPPLDGMLAEERARLAELEAKTRAGAAQLEVFAADLAREQERASASVHALERAAATRAAAEAAWASGSQSAWPVEAALPIELDDSETAAALASLESTLTRAEASGRERARRRAAAVAHHAAAERTLGGARERGQEARSALEAGLASLAKVDARLHTHETELEQAFSELQAGWPTEASAALDARALRADAEAFRASTVERAAAARAAQLDVERAERAHTTRIEAFERAASAHTARLAEHSSAATARAAAHATLAALRKERTAALEGTADAREAESRAAERAARSERERTRAAVSVAERELALAAERALHTVSAADEAEQRAARSEGQLRVALSEAGLDGETAQAALARDPEWLPSTRAQLAELQAAFDAAEHSVSLAKDHVRRLSAQLPAGLEGEQLTTALSAAKLAVRAQASRWAKLEGKLEQDAEAHTQHAALEAELAEVRGRVRPWLELGELIGSHDGSKLRNFAQSLTLEALLGRANAHLAQLAPRYLLERVGGQDLDLQVLDRDLGDEVRPLRSLSGGETFLVSLALALGLAGVRAAETQVESLFIDEGFASLDPASQDLALEALDALQAQGLQVGVITHVRSLAERVPARVEVQPVAQGESRIQVSGLVPLAV